MVLVIAGEIPVVCKADSDDDRGLVDGRVTDHGMRIDSSFRISCLCQGLLSRVSRAAGSQRARLSRHALLFILPGFFEGFGHGLMGESDFGGTKVTSGSLTAFGRDLA